jgi:hypothetical protein
MILVTCMSLGSEGRQYVISLRFCRIFFEEISELISHEKLVNG